MTPIRNQLVYALAVFMTASTVPVIVADTKPNPYTAITDRNPFGLKPPPPPVETKPPEPVVPPGKVILTGITSLLGVRACLEITDQEPGKTATTRKPILREGERDGAVEVISIDLEKGSVKIRNAGLESSISFDTPKLSGAGAPAVAAAAAPAAGGFAPAHLGASAPNIISPANAASGNNSPRSSSVTIIGGSSSGAAAPSFGGGASFGSSGGYQAGGAAVAPAGYGGGYNVAANGGLGSIPTRPLRGADPSAAQQQQAAAAPPVDPVKQYLNMAIDHEMHQRAGILYPPLPPMPR